MPIRLIIADDHIMFVEALRHLLGRSGDMTVVATTNTGDDLFHLIDVHVPDVALVDVSMPGPGIRAIAQSIGDGAVATKLIALTMHLEPAMAEALIDQGFSGYVIKDAAFDELLIAIHQVVEGRTFISAAIREMDRVGSGNAAGLTPRELECLRQAADGLSNRLIAKRLDISVRTVKYHFENILRKLEASRRGEAVAIGRRRNII